MQYHQSRILCALRDKVAENKSLTGHQAMERARARMTRLGSGSRELFDRWLSSFARLARAQPKRAQRCTARSRHRTSSSSMAEHLRSRLCPNRSRCW